MKVHAITTLQTKLGRWIIVLPNAKSWAWSGSRFVEHYDGISREAQVCNFETEQEALDYAVEHVIEKTQNDRKLTLEFWIEQRADLSAGMRGFSDEITVTLASGNPGGKPGEFAEELRQFLSEWFEATVEPLADAKARFREIDKHLAKDDTLGDDLDVPRAPAVPQAAVEVVEAVTHAMEELTGAPVPAGQPGRVAIGYSSYNYRRYSKPWIGLITAWPVGGKPDMKFGSYVGTPSGGEVEILARPGDIIRHGQKDNRSGNGTRAWWGVVEADLTVRDITMAQARKLFQEVK